MKKVVNGNELYKTKKKIRKNLDTKKKKKVLK